MTGLYSSRHETDRMVPASKLKALGRRNRGDIEMAETAAYPYATHLDIKFDPLTLIDVCSLAKTVTDQWYNQTLCKVNESVIRLGVMQGEYHWHKHDNDDEFFFVLSGRFIIDLEGRSIELLPNQGFTVPKGVLHCTRAHRRGSLGGAARVFRMVTDPTAASDQHRASISFVISSGATKITSTLSQ